MGSPYAERRGGGGSPYAQNRGASSPYATPRGGGAPAPAPESHHHHGFLHTLEHVAKQTPIDFKNVAYHSIGGVVAINKALIHDMTHPPKKGEKTDSHLLGIAEGTGKQIKSDLRHPLRHPGYTLLDLLPAANTTAKIAEAARVAKAGGTVAEAGRALVTRPVYGPRTLRRGGLRLKVGSSQSALGATAQRLSDKAIHAAAERKPGGVGDRILLRKMGKAVTEQARTVQTVHQAPGAALIALGRKLKPAEQKALQVVAEEAPLESRVTASSARVLRSSGKERGRHQAELDLLHQAKTHLGTFKAPSPRVFPVKRDEFTGTSNPSVEDNEAYYHLMPKDGKHLYHSTSAESLERIREEGLKPGKERKGETTGVYFAEDGTGVTSLRPSNARSGDVLLRVPKGAVRTEVTDMYEAGSGYEEHVSRSPVPASALEYLGPDNQWHPLIGSTKPVFTGTEARKLNYALARMREVAGSREDLLKGLGQLTDEAIQSRKTNAGRVAVGGSYEKIPARKGRVEQVREYPARSKTVTRDMTEEEAHARLVELDAHYQHLVEQLIPETSPYGGALAKREQLRRNFENSRAGKGNRVGARKQSTVKQEEFRIAEDKLHQTIERNRGNATADRAAKLIAERDQLRHALNERSGLGESATPPALPTVSETVPGKPRRVHLREIAAQKAGGRIVGGDSFTASPEAIRVPDVATRKGARALKRTAKVGSAGSIGHLRALGSTTHEFTGALREHALRREDTTALVGEAGLEAAKYAGLRHVHELVREAVTAEPHSPTDIAVRLNDLKSSKRLPQEVRKFLDAPDEFFKTATPKEAASAFEGVRSRLFVNPHRLDPEAAADFRRLQAEGKIGWVPKQLLGELGKPHLPFNGPALQSVDAINNASRFAILYLKPAYAIPNLLGNAALNVLQQGFAAVPNLRYAARLNERIGPELAARIDTLMGEGFARAISAQGRGVGSKVVDKAASFWSRGVDTPFRRSSFIYEARRAGYRTPPQLDKLLTSPDHLDQLVEITQRANREIIDYANLSHTEREVIRRVVFFYPWVKGSTVYAGRFLREHPVKAAVAGQVGAIGKKNDPVTPSYLEGSFDVGGRLVNPTSSSILQTPAQVGQALAGLAGGDVGQVGELSNFLSPAAALALAAVTRRDRQGYQYGPGSNLGGIAFDQLVKNVPQYTLAQRISDALNGKGQDRLYPPNILDAILQYTVGGVAPRKYNKPKLAELAANERSRYVP